MNATIVMISYDMILSLLWKIYLNTAILCVWVDKCNKIVRRQDKVYKALT